MGEKDCNNVTNLQEKYKTMSSYVNYVMRNLGNQILKIELTEEQVSEIVQMALEELSHYINDYI